MACSSTIKGGAGSGVAGERKLADLEDAERGKLCDYLAARFGGYGSSPARTCSSEASSLKMPVSQSACDGVLATVPDTCPTKVSEAETCFAELASCARAAGDLPASCLLLTQPICGAVLDGLTNSTSSDGGARDASVERSDARAEPPDASAPNGCPGNTKQSVTFISPACQSALEANCCAELTRCFNIVVGNGIDDCNKYSQCIPRCHFKTDGVTPETDHAKIVACQDDCDRATTKAVVDAYDTIAACATNHPAANKACQ